MQFSNQKRNLKVPKLALELDENNAPSVQVKSWGMLDDIRLLPGDKLVLHKFHSVEAGVYLSTDLTQYRSGELLLLRPQGAGRLMLGRKYGETVLAEPFGKSVSLARWIVIGAIRAVERPLGMDSPTDRSLFPSLKNTESILQHHFTRPLLCSSTYLGEVSRRLKDLTPNASLVLAASKSELSGLLEDCPPGVMWFSTMKEEHLSQHACTPSWQAGAKRLRRRAWYSLHKEIDQKKRREQYASMPLQVTTAECTSLASK
ncbi:MAG: hypothetical protein VX278_05965 [Myxococcota bacterium]|nr:hypothetical protein [Myxococcota bacterium]